jgi:uncharacterized protein YkwD
MAMLSAPRTRREAGRHRRRRQAPRHPTLLGLIAVVLLLITGGAVLTNLTATPTATSQAAPEPTAVTDGRDQPPASSSPSPPSPSPEASPTPEPEPTPEPTEAPVPAPETAADPQPERDPDRESRRRAPTTPTDSATALEDEVTALTNQERRAAGCDEVSTDERLRTAARSHSEDMATHDYFSHTGRDGSSFVDRAQAAGYPSPAGENIAYGYATPADVMAGWMNSDGHRRNILNCSHRTIGVGLAYDPNGRPYWTQVFGR